MIWFLAYLATIPAANWLVVNVGLVPVGFGLVAPAGVLLAGLALVLRDLVQRELGAAAGLIAIVLGAAISAFLAPAALVVASTAAFVLSEVCDFAIYTPLQRRGFIRAVVASSLVGLVVDSALFLWLAFGSLDYLAGQIVGKAEMLGAAVIVLSALRVSDGNPSGQRPERALSRSDDGATRPAGGGRSDNGATLLSQGDAKPSSERGQRHEREDTGGKGEADQSRDADP